MTTETYEKLAQEDFDHAQRKAAWRDRTGWLTGKCNQLQSLDGVSQGLLHQAPRHLSLQAVPIDRVVGSEGRSRDFDRAFLPRRTQIKDRWVRIAKAYYEQVPLPPVELLKVGEEYYVRDGNHRVSVARSRGQEFIDAYVTEIVGRQDTG